MGKQNHFLMLSNKCTARSYCNRSILVQVIVKDAVACFFETQCRAETNHCVNCLLYSEHCDYGTSMVVRNTRV